MVKTLRTRKSSKVKLEVGLNVFYLLMGLALGILGNLWVGLLFKMVETNFFPSWVISFAISFIALFGLGVWMWKTAVNLIKSS